MGAIYELNRDVDLPYIRLRQSSIRNDGTPLTVIGFGDMDPGKRDDESDYLMRVSVDYMDQSVCRSQVDGISSDMLCTYESVNGACFGDSGGPLFLEGSSPGEDELVGLVSYGSEDGNVGVYARISHLYDWIVANMCEMNPAGAPEEIDCGNVDTNLGGGNEITSAPSGDSTDSSSIGFGDDNLLFDDDEGQFDDDLPFDDDFDNDEFDDDIGLSTQVPSSFSSISSSLEFDDDLPFDDDFDNDMFDDENGPSTLFPSSFSSSSSSSSFEFDDDAHFDDDNLKSARRQKNNLRLESQYESSSASGVSIPRSGAAFVTSTALLSLVIQYWL